MVILKKGIDRIKHSISSKHWVEQIVDDVLNSTEDRERTSMDFYPSAAGKCPRAVQFAMIGMVKEKFEPRVRRIFDSGNDMHNRYKKYFEKAGRLVSEESPARAVIEGIAIRGRIDMIVKNFLDEERLLELKTVNSRKFEDILKKNMYIEDHYTQWNLYAGVLKMQFGEILYENKDDQRMKVFTVCFNQEKFDKTIGIFKMISYHIGNGTIVPKPEKCDSKFCAAKDLCKGIDSQTEKVRNVVQLGNKKCQKD